VVVAYLGFLMALRMEIVVGMYITAHNGMVTSGTMMDTGITMQ